LSEIRPEVEVRCCYRFGGSFCGIAFAYLLLILQDGTGAGVLCCICVIRNVCRCLRILVMDRLERAGWNIPALPLPDLGLSLYVEYWIIAPDRNWSRWPVLGIPVAVSLALVCLLIAGRFI